MWSGAVSISSRVELQGALGTPESHEFEQATKVVGRTTRRAKSRKKEIYGVGQHRFT
ncbi:hypothetical protein SAMN05421783_112108 [Thiocapsa roseopersicina]|uniref:Uncharacterized protein n=1 Tax=Thiocapsa roseopersicina TaxID=1058 RepID=A0A1H2YA00_THIRO|nr:hypothetical protein SAMN05421783_112108 [Thiocapsa roseopersicina]